MKQLIKQFLYVILVILIFFAGRYSGKDQYHGEGFGHGKVEGFTLGVWYARGDSDIITFTGEKNWLLSNFHKEDSMMQEYKQSKQ